MRLFRGSIPNVIRDIWLLAIIGDDYARDDMDEGIDRRIRKLKNNLLHWNVARLCESINEPSNTIILVNKY
jgi:hypothetical protein